MYVIVISRARGMYGIYCTEAQGPCARGLRGIKSMSCIPSARDITSLYPVGIATIDTH
jgi:hypothetical protein